MDMLDNPLYLEYDGQIQLEIGHLYEAIEEFTAAVDQYRYVDTTFKSKPESAEASYALGKLYETKGANYDKAFEHYGNARTAYPGIAAAVMGGKKADVLGDYRRLRNRMFDVDTLLFYVLNPDSLAVRDSLQAIADSLSRQKLAASGGEPETEEELFQRKLARRRPHGRNTGRVNPYKQSAEATLTPTPLGTPAPGAAAAAGLQPLYRTRDVRKLSADSVLQELSLARVDMGWTMLDKLSNIDSAGYYYKLGLDGSLPDDARANTLYALAAVSRQKGDSVLAESYENRLLQEAPGSRYALDIMAARGMEIPRDSSVILREAYDRAAALLESGNIEGGITALRKLSESFPLSEQAARAIFAVAFTFETVIRNNDTALALYKELARKYPSSQYSARGREILASIDRIPKEEEERKRRAEEEKKAEEERIRQMARPEPVVQSGGDTTRSRLRRKTDPTRDPDFPLMLPGEKAGDKQAKPGAETPGLDGQSPEERSGAPGQDLPQPGKPGDAKPEGASAAPRSTPPAERPQQTPLPLPGRIDSVSTKPQGK